MDYASDISIPTKKEASASFNDYELANFYIFQQKKRPVPLLMVMS